MSVCGRCGVSTGDIEALQAKVEGMLAFADRQRVRLEEAQTEVERLKRIEGKYWEQTKVASEAEQQLAALRADNEQLQADLNQEHKRCLEGLREIESLQPKHHYMTKMGAALQEEVSKLHEENKRLKADLLTVAESKASIRAEERERAAKIVEKQAGNQQWGRDLAAALRSTGEQT